MNDQLEGCYSHEVIVEQVERFNADGPWQYVHFTNGFIVGFPPMEHTIEPGDRIVLYIRERERIAGREVVAARVSEHAPLLFFRVK